MLVQQFFDYLRQGREGIIKDTLVNIILAVVIRNPVFPTIKAPSDAHVEVIEPENHIVVSGIGVQTVKQSSCGLDIGFIAFVTAPVIFVPSDGAGIVAKARDWLATDAAFVGVALLYSFHTSVPPVR